jgi:hypothetical protein
LFLADESTKEIAVTSVAAPDAQAGEEVWRPSPQRSAASTMASYVRWLADHEGLAVHGPFDET